MRVLKFIVDGNSIEQDPSCDFSGLFPGAEKHVKMEFAFSPNWTDAVKVVAFWSILGTEYPPQVLDENDSCMVPEEALIRPVFKLQVLGSYKGNTFRTNMVDIHQRGVAYEPG